MKKIVCILLLLLLSQWSRANDPILEDLLSRCKTENTAKSWGQLAYYYLENNYEVKLIRETADKAYELAIKENSDEEIGSILIMLAELNYWGQWDAYIEQLQKALEHLDKANRPSLQIEAIGNIGYVYNLMGKYDEAILQYKEAEKLFSKIEKRNKIAAPIYINMGFSYLYKGQTDSTLYYISRAKDEAIAANDTLVLIECNNQLGIINKRKGDFASAIDHFAESLELYELTRNNKAICTTLLNIAAVYNEWRVPNKALHFARESVRRASEFPEEKNNLGRALAGLGSILSITHHYQAALDTLQLAVPLLEESKYDSYIAYLNMAQAYNDLDQIDSADVYIQKAEVLLTENAKFPPHRFYAGKGSLLVKRGQYKAAIPILEKYVEESQNTSKNFIFGEYDIYNQLAVSLERGEKDYKKALFYKNMAYDYRDSLYREEQDATVNEYFVKYQTAEKDLKISQLNREQQEMRYNRMLMIGIFIIVVILLLLAWLYNRLQVTRRDKEAIVLNKRIEEKDNDYQMLLNDIELRQMKHYLTGLEAERERLAKELHDNISNNLFVLDMELKANKQVPASVHARMEDLYTQVRSISHELMPPAFQYASLYQALESYLDALNEQSDIRFEWLLEGDEVEVPQSMAFEIYRIIQEATGNILKHSHARTARVGFQVGETGITLVVEDDGAGFDVQKKKKGIGLQIIIDRCKSIGGKLDINSEPGKGCRLIITIPFSPQDSGVSQ